MTLAFTPYGIWTITAVGFVVMVPVLVVVRRYDGRLLSGESVWSKPVKFALSLAVHFATFAVVTAWLPESHRSSDWLLVTSMASSAAAALEFVYIGFQAARRRHSHFNVSTRVEAAMYSLMGIGAVILLSPAVVEGLAIAVAPLPEWPSAIRAGVATGLLGGAALTLLTAVRMGKAMSRFAGPPPELRRTMWLTGWSLNGPDLRPAHFMATHMMQVVPAVSVAAAVLLPGPVALTVTLLFAAAWAWVTIRAYRSALKGQSLPSVFEAFAI